MVEELVEYKASMLVWSALGGGSISLPYMEQEAFGEIDARFRFYGFVNDSEFIAECQKHGIKVFGIVFEVQGWEFPVELNEAEDQVLSMNETRSAGKPAWMGLREFTQNRYPKLWKPLEHYFPDGLVNSDGDTVTDILEECCSRDIHGEPCHAHWVESPDRDHYCYAMDRNNPVWREYLKAIIRIQIDAGVDGVQLDEAELPITSMQYGGCFCKDCMKGFRSYLAKRPELIPDGVTIEDFHYGEWLLAQGFDFKQNQSDSPLFLDYLRYQQREITRYFKELADYARSYGHSQGRDVQVSGNFFNLNDHYLPLEPSVDVIITEMRNTTYRQPAWYRYVAGFAGDKPVVIVENPYGGIVSDLVRDLKVGRSYDRFRLSLFEAAALGASMSIPYGAWMGSVVQDSFWPPHELCVEINEWLDEHEHLYSSTSAAKIAVVYSTESNFELETRDPELADNTVNPITDDKVPFWHVTEALADALQPYDVVIFPDGDLREDKVAAEQLARYETVVLPHVHVLTDTQKQALSAYEDAGGRVVTLGPEGPFDDASALVDAPQVTVSRDIDAAISLQVVDGGVAVHLIRYDFDGSSDAVPALDEVTLSVTLPDMYEAATAYGSPKPPTVELQQSAGTHTLTLRDVPLYSVVLLGPAGR
jgi:hypothetical protein